MKIYQKTVVTLLVLTLVPLIAISVVTYIIAEKNVVKETMNHIESVANLQKARVESAVSRNRERLDLITSRVPMRAAIVEFMKTGGKKQHDIALSAIFGAKEAVEDIKDISILSPKGKVIVSTNSDIAGSEHSKEEWFIRGKKGYVLDILSFDRGEKVINYLSCPIYHEGKFIGVLLIESYFEPIQAVTRDYAGLGYTGETTLSKRDRDGDALFVVPLRHDPDAAFKRKVSKEQTNVPVVIALMKKEESMFSDLVDYRGVPVLAVTRHIHETGWGIVVKIDRDEAYKPVYQLRNMFAAAVIIVAALAAAISSLISSSFTMPIVNLSNVAKRMSERDWSARADITSSDEIGELGKYFNEMTDDLISANDLLKWKVEEVMKSEAELIRSEAELLKSNNLLNALSRAQNQFIEDTPSKIIFDLLLNNLLHMTKSEYGFIGEVFYKDSGEPFLKTHAITNTAWNEETQALYEKNLLTGMEFHNLKSLFGEVMTTGKTVISNNPSEDPRRCGIPDGHPPLNAFLGLPFYKGNRMVGMVGIANRPDGYDENMVAYLQPFLITCANIIHAHRNNLQRKDAEESLIKSEARTRSIIESSQDCICNISIDGKFISMNPAGCAINELDSPEEMIGKSATASIIENRKEAEEAILRAAGGETVSLQYKSLSKKGREICWDSKVTPLMEADGSVKSVLRISRDITERKNMEEERINFSRLESIGILAGGIAHDFNNILTGILGNIYVAKKRLEPNSKALEMLVSAEKACERANDLTNQFLIFSKGGAPVKRLADIAEIIRESTGFTLHGSDVRCELSIPDGLWLAEVDQGQINQVLNNLIINADHAMPDGGVIEVSAENIVVNRETGLLISEGEYIKISVKDHGIGIPNEYLGKIFDPYFSTKGRGSGLGLAVSYSIIKKHNGYITVDSEIGKGTTFCIYLPASKEEQAEKIKIKESPVLGSGKILVIDDEEYIRESAANLLESIGYNVESAKDGAEGIEAYKKALEQGKPFDAVITDLTIPGGMGGEEAIKRLKEIDPRIKAIVSSGYSNDTIMANFKDYGFSGALKKPYDIMRISEALDKVIKGI